jgi:hypothetical protein
MATKIYDTAFVKTVDDVDIYIIPLKIKYLREFLVVLEKVRSAANDDEAISLLVECARISMKQYYPEIKTTEDLEDSFDLPTIYKIIDVAGGIKVSEKSEEPVKQQAVESGTTWEKLDLAKLESEVFLLGIWKDYEELETSLSMPELVATLESKRELDHEEKRFLAAIQGIDIDKGKNDGQDAWQKMKAKHFSGGRTTDANDVVALQGANASKAGFGIGMGLGYQDLTKKTK